MPIYDKDLLSVQEARELIEKARIAQEKLAEMTQEQVDTIVKSICEAGVRNAKRLGVMAFEETGYGIAEDKEIKNIFASSGVYEAIKDMKTVGVIARDEKARTIDIAVPVGVVVGLVPSTNPTSTAIFKSMISIKSGNAIVFSPHPSAKESILETVRVIRRAVAEAGGSEDLVGAVTVPTVQATDALMHHPSVATILATGGSAMVKAAYSSGNPAIGVGPGNGPAFIEKSADIKASVRRIIESKTFDNGTICASEQSVICEKDMEQRIRTEMESQGAYFLDDEKSKKLGKFILRANGTMNPQIVGRSVKVIANLAGIDVPDNAKVLVAKEDGIGRGHPYSNEKLAPILGFYVEDDYKAVCQRSVDILRYEGAGHTFIMHSENEEIINYFAKRIPVSRFLVNTAGALGGVGATTSLMPSYTLGCGAVGGSAVSDNVGPMNLINIKKVAYGIREVSDLRAEVANNFNTKLSNNSSSNLDYDGIDLDLIVKQVIEKLKNI